MTDWRRYDAVFPGPTHAVSGDLRVWQAGGATITVLLPPSYTTTDRRYPVLYMTDGQNLFDAARAHSDEWQVDEAMARLATEGTEAIVVAVDNAGRARTDEYSPFVIPGEGGGSAASLLRRLTGTIMAEVESAFRVSTRRADTFLAGSSLGALFCLYALCERPDRFGGAGLMSPSLWPADGEVFRYLEGRTPCDARIYLDVGTRELSGRAAGLRLHGRSRRFRRDVRRLAAALAVAADDPAMVRMIEERGARHEEAAWARRFPGMLLFLLGTTTSPAPAGPRMTDHLEW